MASRRLSVSSWPTRREFAMPQRRPARQQASHVRARDAKDRDRQDIEDQQHPRFELTAADARLELRLHEDVLTFVRARVGPRQLARDDAQLGAGFIHRHAWPQPGLDRRRPQHPVGARIPSRDAEHLALHRQRDERFVRDITLVHARVRLIRDADDGEGVVADPHRPSDDAGVAIEQALPESVTQHSDSVAARHPILLRRKATPEKHRHAELVEEVATDGRHKAHALRLRRQTRGGLLRVVRDPRLHRLASSANVVEVGIRHLRFTGRAERDRHADREQPFGVADGKRPQEQCVSHAEHGHVGSSAERDGQHGDRREAGVLHQQPRTVPHILPDVVDPAHVRENSAGSRRLTSRRPSSVTPRDRPSCLRLLVTWRRLRLVCTEHDRFIASRGPR
jgi:hypothetical protein